MIIDYINIYIYIYYAVTSGHFLSPRTTGMVWNDEGFELGYIDTDLAPGFFTVPRRLSLIYIVKLLLFNCKILYNILPFSALSHKFGLIWSYISVSASAPMAAL